jgi:colicin import membrane protein
MKTELVKFETPELLAIEKSKAEKIKLTFEPMAKMLSEFEAEYNQVISDAETEVTKDVCNKARRVRIDIGRVRIETGKLKDKQKEYIKLEDRAIMGVHNILVWAVKEKEDKLKEIENYFEIQEQKRREELQRERAQRLSEYIDDAHERDLAKFEDDEFDALLSIKKKEKEDRIAAEKKAEEDRIKREKKEAAERERMRKENERLKKEAEEKERLAKIEAEKRAQEEMQRRQKEEVERKAREEKERKEREAYEAKIKTEREAREKVEREEREKRQKLEAQIQAKEEADRKEREQKEAQIQAELNKTDEGKINDLVNDLTNLKTKYSFKADKNKDMYKNVSGLIDKVVNYIKSKQ